MAYKLVTGLHHDDKFFKAGTTLKVDDVGGNDAFQRLIDVGALVESDVPDEKKATTAPAGVAAAAAVVTPAAKAKE